MPPSPSRSVRYNNLNIMEPTLKRATWLELFYDLAFVALVAQLTYLAAKHHHSVTDIFNIIITAYTIFFTWWTTTVNRNLQSTEDRFDQIAVQLKVAGAFVMSVAMADVFAGQYAGYFVALGCIRLIQVALLFRLYTLEPQHAPKTYNIATGILIAAGLWFVSGFIPAPYHFVIAIAALMLDMLTPLTHGRGNAIRLLNVHHLQERLGLFLMLVLGESMLVVALANTSAASGAALPYVVFSGLIITTTVWWLYFDYLEHCTLGKRPRKLFWYLQGHSFLFLALIFVAAGYKNSIDGGGHSESTIILVASGLIGVLLGLLAIRLALTTLPKRVLVVFVTAMVVIISTTLFIQDTFTAFTLITVTFIALGLTDRLLLRAHK